jgi:uncharacterized protein (DUF362 family)
MFNAFEGFPLIQAEGPPDLSLVSGAPPDALTRKAVELLGGMNQFITQGDVVLVKPNIAFDRKPRFAGCTNPEVVKTVVELCVKAGAEEVRVMDNPVHPAAATYINSGIAEAVEQAGGRLIYPDPNRLESASLNGENLKTAAVFTDVLEADKIINVPILKTHPLTRLTMGMKNLMGAIGGNRSIYHQDVDEVIVDLARYFKPVLTVLDAYRVMVKNGPDGGRISDVNMLETVIAGRDIVAVDALGATLCNYEPKDLSFLKIANKQGLGEIELQKLRIEMRSRKS